MTSVTNAVSEIEPMPFHWRPTGNTKWVIIEGIFVIIVYDTKNLPNMLFSLEKKRLSI